MAVGKAEILDSIANMTVLELSQLIKEMEEKFGVSAAAVAVASAAPAAHFFRIRSRHEPQTISYPLPLLTHQIFHRQQQARVHHP